MPVDCDIEEFEPIDSSRKSLVVNEYLDNEEEDDDEVDLLRADKDSIRFYSSAERT
jgi:hypothetical protein